MALVHRIANWVSGLTYEGIPEHVRQKARTCVLHGLGVGMAGTAVEFGAIAAATVQALDGSGPATVLLNGSRATAAGAAFANSVLLHSRTQEDTHGTTHVGTVVIPTVLALAEETGASGREALVALVAGYEVAAAMGRRHTALSTPRGFRASSIYGVFGAAAAAARLLGLTPEQTAHTLGYAAAFAGGTTQCFIDGTQEWRFEVGQAARSGILAATVTKHGAVAARGALEGTAGFFHAFTGDTDPSDVAAGLGETWEILNVGFKPYPVCAFNQTPVAAVLSLARRHGVRVQDVQSVEVRMSTYEANYPGMGNWGPFASIGASLMSTPFCVALALADGHVTLAGLQRYADPEVLDMVRRVGVVPEDGRKLYSCALRITTRAGTVLTEDLDVDAQHYDYPWEQDEALIRSLAPEMRLPAGRLDQAIHMIRRLEELPDLRGLMAILTGKVE